MKHFNQLVDLANHYKLDCCITCKHNLIGKCENNKWNIVPYNHDENGYYKNHKIQILEFNSYGDVRDYFMSDLKKVSI